MKPAGRPRATWEGQLGTTGGMERDRQTQNGAFLVCGGTIGHCPLRGRCPKMGRRTSIMMMKIDGSSAGFLSGVGCQNLANHGIIRFQSVLFFPLSFCVSVCLSISLCPPLYIPLSRARTDTHARIQTRTRVQTRTRAYGHNRERSKFKHERRMDV